MLDLWRAPANARELPPRLATRHLHLSQRRLALPKSTDPTVLEAGSTPTASYAASKHAVVGLTRTEAIAYASQGICINAICPGYVATPILKAASEAGVSVSLIKDVLKQQLGEPEKTVDTIFYLASPMSRFMTGATLAVDGGHTSQ